MPKSVLLNLALMFCEAVDIYRLILLIFLSERMVIQPVKPLSFIHKGILLELVQELNHREPAKPRSRVKWLLKWR